MACGDARSGLKSNVIIRDVANKGGKPVLHERIRESGGWEVGMFQNPELSEVSGAELAAEGPTALSSDDYS